MQNREDRFLSAEAGQISYMVSTAGVVTAIDQVLLRHTGYLEDDILNQDVAEILLERFRLPANIFEQLALNGSLTCFLFSKSFDVLEALITVKEEPNTDEKTYAFSLNTDYKIDEKFAYVTRLCSDNRSGIAIFSKEFVLLKMNQKFLDFLDRPYDQFEKSIGRSAQEIGPGFAGSETEDLWKNVIRDKETLYMKERRFDGFARGETYWDFTIVPILESGMVRYLIVNAAEVTESVRNRKKVEEQLETIKLKQEQFEAIFENSMDGIMLTSPDGAIIAANQAACQMLGYTEGEIRALGNHGRNALVDLTDPRLPVALEERKRTGSFKGGLTFVRKDGEKIEVDETSRVFLNQDGQQLTSMIIRDITARQLAEKEAFQHHLILKGINRVYEKACGCENINEFKRTCLEMVTSITGSKFVFICEIGPAGFFHDIIINGAKWVLSKTNSVKGQEYQERDKISIHDLDDRVILEGGSFLTKAISADGINAESWGNPNLTGFFCVPYLHNGRKAGLLGVGYHDPAAISEYREVITPLVPTIFETMQHVLHKAKLRDSELSLRLASEGAALGTYSYDFTTGKTNLSAELETIWGVEKINEDAAVDGDLLYKGLHHDDREAFLSAVRAAGDPLGDGVLKLDYRIIRPDGAVRWLHVQGQTIFSYVGENRRRPIFAAGAVIDITDRKTMEEEIRSQKERLDAVIESMSDGIVIGDNHSNFTFLNSAAKVFFNHSEKISNQGDPVKYNQYYYDIDGEEIPLNDLPGFRVFNSGGYQDYRFTIRHPDKKIYCSVNGKSDL